MPKRTDIQKILLIGSGPIVIGQACEFDYSGTQACKALREEGYEVVLVNSNPATIMTDPGTAERTYIEPLDWRIVEKIIAKERPDALLPTLGGQTGLNVAMDLSRHGVLEKYDVEMIGARADVIAKAEEREQFKQAMDKIGNDEVRVRDYGRGIPLGKVVDCVSKINTGGKYDSRAFKKSVGLNGVGTKAVNALSTEFVVESVREGQMKRAGFVLGELTDDAKVESTTKRNGTRIRFKPDPDIFKAYRFRTEHVEKLLWNYAYLNTGLTLYLNGEKFRSEHGLKDLLENSQQIKFASTTLWETWISKSVLLKWVWMTTAKVEELLVLIWSVMAILIS